MPISDFRLSILRKTMEKAEFENRVVNKIVCGDCLAVMQGWPDGCVDTVITDPPYGLSFMGKKWDYDVPSIEIFREVLRVMKPGGTLLCFAGSRTQHRMAVNIEDAGFILKDCIMWLYGSGFPKATDISKQLDKGHERKVIGEKADPRYKSISTKGWREYRKSNTGENNTAAGSLGCYEPGQIKETKPATPEAQLWNGWKSHGLKPAYEPILVAMKTNDGSYAANALKHGVSGLNIDGGRIGYESEKDKKDMVRVGYLQDNKGNNFNNPITSKKRRIDLGKITLSPTGRFPANVILDEISAAMLDEQSGVSKSTDRVRHNNQSKFSGKGIYGKFQDQDTGGFNDSGGASRFFYCAKASKRERNAGCEGLEGHNHHPTVKPLAFMEYLCTLTSTPTGGLVLDPFCGSGSTLLACLRVGRSFIGIEKEGQYCEIAERRVEAERKRVYTCIPVAEQKAGQMAMFEGGTK